jgi:hypothetical protein
MGVHRTGLRPEWCPSPRAGEHCPSLVREVYAQIVPPPVNGEALMAAGMNAPRPVR